MEAGLFFEPVGIQQHQTDSRPQATAAEITALAERSDLTAVAARVSHALRKVIE